MIRIGRLTDYGIVLLSHMAGEHNRPRSAADLAVELRLPQPTVSKLLRILSKSGLLQSQRGVKGGYALAAMPEHISIARIVAALEGPVALTMCSGEKTSDCEYEPLCGLSRHWRKINAAIHGALESISLADVAATPNSGSRAGDDLGARSLRSAPATVV